MVSGGSNSVNDPEGTERDYMGNLATAPTPTPAPTENGNGNGNDVPIDIPLVTVKFINLPQSSTRNYTPITDTETFTNDPTTFLSTLTIPSIKGTGKVNLLSLSARHNIVIPSGCRTGICGSCTAEIYVPGWKSETDGSSKDDWQLIRCCSAGAVDVCDGEIVVDLRGVARSRSPSTSTSTSIQLGEGEGEQEREPNNDPLARFSANWENEYVPDYMNEKKARKDLRSANVIDESIGVMGVLQPPWEYVPGGGANANANEKSTKTTYKSKSNDDLTEKEKVEAEIYLDKGRQVKRKKRRDLNSISNPAPPRGARGGEAPWEKIW
ncbi:hypothetical protein ScalyP_jg8130 [Parmales sp. scaly parma]|nr:hypothetical protein ScalyP_jg8130 [Parmales sp. scaly parma]